MSLIGFKINSFPKFQNGSLNSRRQSQKVVLFLLFFQLFSSKANTFSVDRLALLNWAGFVQWIASKLSIWKLSRSGLNSMPTTITYVNNSLVWTWSNFRTTRSTIDELNMKMSVTSCFQMIEMHRVFVFGLQHCYCIFFQGTVGVGNVTFFSRLSQLL